MIFLLIIAAAVGLLAWPESGKSLSLPTAGAKAPSYRSAIESLASVRSRLISTGNLDEKATEAINSLTLCLVAGSDKE